MNFNALVSTIQVELNDYSARTKANIEKWANQGHKNICQMRNWNFLNVRKSDEMTFGSADIPIDITADIELSSTVVPAQQILAVYDVTDGNFDEVKQIQYEKLRDICQTDYSQDAPPLYWYFINDKEIEFFPELSADRVFQFSFKKLISTYASGATTALLIPDTYIDVLHEYVLMRAYRFKSDDRTVACEASYKEMLAAMIKSESNKIGVIPERSGNQQGIFPMLVEV